MNDSFRKILSGRFAKALHTYGDEAVVQRESAELLTEEICRLKGRKFPSVLEAGCHAGLLTRLIEKRFSYDKLVLLDIVEECAPLHAARKNASFVCSDIEEFETPDKFQLILANAVFQYASDPEKLFRKLGTMLTDGGTLAFTVFGKGNLPEIASLTGNALAEREKREWETLLRQCGYGLLFSVEKEEKLFFDTPVDVLRHLKKCGSTFTGKENPAALWTQGRLDAFSKNYIQQFSTGAGRVSLTYRPLVVIAEKKI